ncbi:hypothetical protein M0811_13657 [Anaeramoeba ignava]|uniref:Uncharacterized protein n=1 Tax=Anaeramoeba ignava TaxID=1746090 RepID=A0A9Q0L513_ANAIG|nr:hypothetical protein M0811_13657 [Anaeramoeba ignava]
MRTSEVLPIWIVNSIIIIIIIAPSLGVASKDKDKDCSKPLWTWVLVFNICLGVTILFPIFLLNRNFYVIMNFLNGLISLFLIVWSIIGLVWATREGVKDECGKLYSVTLGESIVIISLAGCGCLLLCLFGICWECGLKDINFA